MAKCVNCVAGMHTLFCLTDGKCNEENANAEAEISSVENEEREANVYKDPISTGRKRAAVLYPLKAGMVCEWAYRKNCGGGISPIMGCSGRPATHIHHGPDKSTLNNERENISLVCNFCHNRWHVANDPFYPEPRPADNSEWLPTGGKKAVPEGAVIQRLDQMVKADKTEILLHEMTLPEGGKDAR